ncbi:MAG: DUF4906 domain-containing protein [Bacteroidales bacterium]|nr:DUF4906 domain-containing protein [Bacteroidales bacterium]
MTTFMKHHTVSTTLVVVMLMALTGCVNELEPERRTNPNYRGESVDAFLNITVGELSVSLETRANGDVEDPYEDKVAERWVNDLWLFQYDAATEIAIADPIYLTVKDQETLKNLPVTLSDNDGDECLIYVVTNTGDDSWGEDAGFNTVDGLLTSALPTREPIFVTTATTESDLSIPMEGGSGNVFVTTNRVITVPVARMYAKIMIDPRVEIGDAETEVYTMAIGNLPLYCRVGTLYDGDDANGATYPENVQWISRGFTEGLDEDEYDYPYVVYVPENLQGQRGDEATSKIEDGDAPARAFYIDATISYTDEEGGRINYPYTFYPGANTTNDYNIKRNNVYRVKLSISTLSMTRVPSANCLFAYEGETIAFFPYYRVETGGGYDFEDYLYPTPDDGTGKEGSKIDHVGIIWQTEDCIGDNTDGTRVYLVSYTGDDDTHNGYEKIYVKTSKEGNALIGAYDAEGNIIWSWHIWVRTAANGDPTNFSRAKVYYTYYWDETGIYSNDSGRELRIAGYQLMACNLGALQDEPIYANNRYFGHDPNSNSTADEYIRQVFEDGDGIVRTFGMLYQWGRKDPFPPMTTTEGMYWTSRGNIDTSQGYNTGYYVHNYDDDHTETHYGNDNTTVAHKTSYEIEDYLFHTHVASQEEGMRYAIAHPTVFLSGASTIAICLDGSSSDNSDYTSPLDDRNKTNYAYEGAWSSEDHDYDNEWGGLDPVEDGTMKYYHLGISDDAGNPISLWDNYDDDTGTGAKSIFDPCPYGWRVASGELWLGFTRNGINPNGNMSNVSFDYTRSCLLGMTMYLGPVWRTDPTTWFPCQGFRLPDGSGYRVGGCGNYVNANTDLNDRINIVHLHYQQNSFKQFETQVHYTAKSTGNPLRCVREIE